MLEYFIHGKLMHKKCFAHKQFRRLYKIFYRHAIMHHKNNQHHINIDFKSHIAISLASPAILTTYIMIDLVHSLIVFCIALSYAYLWTKLHRSIHDLEDNWTKHIPKYYQLARRHHLLHPKDPNKNLGTVFLFTDILFGTKQS